jgi:glycerol-3-phosphate dehydrogenase
MRSRADRVQKLRQMETCDVLIVGAGINGIGTYHDLVLQGLNVVLVDRNDYCSGASAASSHMIHGGLRYLENGEFRLVNEAVQERGLLLQNAPHLVKPLPTTFPIFKRFSGLLNAPLKFLGLRVRPGERGALVIKIGLLLYDWFARNRKVVPHHIFRSHDQSLKLFPALNPEVLYTATYYDAAMPSPERLALEVLMDAQQVASTSVALNYVCLKSTQGAETILQDEQTGELIRIRPKVVVNAAGPWIDVVNQAMGQPSHYIGGTKGSHLVLNNPELRATIGDHEIFFENEDGRLVLIFPLFDRVIIGTSDIRVDNPDNAVITEEEIDYFFEMVKRVFPTIELNRNQIVFTFCGVRPLPKDESDNTDMISRDHKIEVVEPNDQRPFPIYSLVGGKWTTFRALAKQASLLVLQRLGCTRRTGTADLRIGGGRHFPDSPEAKEKLLTTWQLGYDLPVKRGETLLSRYGTKATEILRANGTARETPMLEYPDFSIEEIKFLINQEDVVHLDDLVFRRSTLGMLGRITQPGLNELATITASALNWDARKVRSEIDRVRKFLQSNHRMHFNQYLGPMRGRRWSEVEKAED